MGNRDKLLKLLKRELNPNHAKNLKLFTIVEQKDIVVFRMQASFFVLEDLWSEISAIAEKAKIKTLRVDLFANVKELDNLLSKIEWLWESNIPKGFVTMVAGEPGIGKSLVVLDLAKIVISGSSFPNSEQKCKGSSVLWIDTEMKQQLLNERAKFLGIDRERLWIPAINGNPLTKFDASDPEHVAHIVALIEDKKPELMVVDSLGHAHSRGENRIEEVRPIMDFFTGIARDYNMAVAVIHHLNKGREGETTEVSLGRVRGSTDIIATPVIIFALEHGSKQGEIKIRQIKNNIGIQQMPLSAEIIYHDEEKTKIKSLTYSLYTPPPPKKTKKELCAEWLRDELSKSKHGTPLVEIIEAGAGRGYSRANIYSARDVLGDEITFGGTGNKAIWYLGMPNDEKTINKISKEMKRSKK